MKSKILEHAQKHGDYAFLQGYEAAKRGISLADRLELSNMPEAQKRITAFQKIFNELKDKR